MDSSRSKMHHRWIIRAAQMVYAVADNQHLRGTFDTGEIEESGGSELPYITLKSEKSYP